MSTYGAVFQFTVESNLQENFLYLFKKAHKNLQNPQLLSLQFFIDFATFWLNSLFVLRRSIHTGKNQDTTCSALHRKPRLCPWLRFTIAMSTDHGGPRTPDLFNEKRRRNHFTTTPLNFITAPLEIFRPVKIIFGSGARRRGKNNSAKLKAERS